MIEVTSATDAAKAGGQTSTQSRHCPKVGSMISGSYMTLGGGICYTMAESKV